MTLTPARILSLLLLLFSTPSSLTAQTFTDDGARAHKHIRTTDRRLLRLLRDGVRGSDTFRRLVDRIRASDVVVYLECGDRDRPSGGRLTFVSAVAGYRYVHVRVARLASADIQIALIGHELRHAVEIADAPGVVDASSLAREYERIGYVSPRLTPGVSFDSHAAVETGYQVLRDLSGKESSQRPTPNLQVPSAMY
jgi:hypothetical protein